MNYSSEYVLMVSARPLQIWSKNNAALSCLTTLQKERAARSSHKKSLHPLTKNISFCSTFRVMPFPACGEHWQPPRTILLLTSPWHLTSGPRAAATLACWKGKCPGVSVCIRVTCRNKGQMASADMYSLFLSTSLLKIHFE